MAFNGRLGASLSISERYFWGRRRQKRGFLSCHKLFFLQTYTNAYAPRQQGLPGPF